MDISDDNSFHQGGDYSLGVETLEVWVGLSSADKHDGLATDVGHGNCRADLERKGKRTLNSVYLFEAIAPYLVIDGVKLSEDDSINSVRILIGRVICKRCIELNELVNGLIADKSLANKQHQVRRID